MDMSMVKKERLKMKWSQAELARHVVVSVRTVKRWDAGEIPSFDNMRKLSGVFGKSISDLFPSVFNTPCHTNVA